MLEARNNKGESMKKRNPLAVILLTFITFGLYGIYWLVVTKGEMNQRGAKIPTAILIIIPLVNIWWMWEYSVGVEHVTKGKMSSVLAFILLWLLGFIGMAIIQDSFNNAAGEEIAAPAQPTATPAEPTQTV